MANVDTNPNATTEKKKKGASPAPAASAAPASSESAPAAASSTSNGSSAPAADSTPAPESGDKLRETQWPADVPRVYGDNTGPEIFSALTAAQKARDDADAKINALESEIAFRLYQKKGKTTLPDGRAVRARRYEKTGKIILVEIGSASDVEI